MALETTAGGIAFLLGRILIGGVLAFMGLNHFQQTDSLAGYAESKGVPAPKLSVLASGLMLVVGGLSIVLGLFPIVGAALLVLFHVVVTPKMHDFWNVEDPEQRQNEMTSFLKNAVMTGAALLIVAIGGANWPYSLTV